MDFTTVEPGKLSLIASGFDARPMSFVQAGQRLGYEPAVAQVVCDRLGLEPSWTNLPIEDFYTALSSGEYDAIWFNQTITQERRAWADFTRPYGRFDDAVLTLEESGIHGPEDIADKRLAVVEGSISTLQLENLPQAEVIQFPGGNQVLPDLLDALKQGSIHAILGNALMLMAMEAEDSSFRVAFQMPTQHPFGVGVLPGNRELLDALNDSLNYLIVDGTLAKLWGKWIPYRPFPF
ncbi:amino acid ABC transporter substrate-binding protein [filamentous cyanobacterium CCP5]|nr:amino acid ABC transporter substrate-binding protein [filamentous cyanobacterium CCP5]